MPGSGWRKSVEATRHEFGSVRTGRASPALLDRISVDYYGTSTPLKQLATISAPEPRLLTIQPYDKSSIKAIERAILESDVGLTPTNDGNLIRLGSPRADRGAPQAARQGRAQHREEGRVAIRNIRRDVMHDLRELKEAGEAGSDDEHRAEVELQKVTDARISELDELLKHKEDRDPGGLVAPDADGRHQPGPRRRGRSGRRPLRRDHHRRQRSVGAASAGCRWWPATRPAPTRSRRACATPSSSGSRS